MSAFSIKLLNSCSQCIQTQVYTVYFFNLFVEIIPAQRTRPCSKYTFNSEKIYLKVV